MPRPGGRPPGVPPGVPTLRPGRHSGEMGLLSPTHTSDRLVCQNAVRETLHDRHARPGPRGVRRRSECSRRRSGRRIGRRVGRRQMHERVAAVRRGRDVLVGLRRLLRRPRHADLRPSWLDPGPNLPQRRVDRALRLLPVRRLRRSGVHHPARRERGGRRLSVHGRSSDRSALARPLQQRLPLHRPRDEVSIEVSSSKPVAC